MVQAFTDVSELDLFAGQLAQLGEQGTAVARALLRDLGPELVRHMRGEVPVASGETRDSITVEYDSDGLGLSVGPTNVDAKGRPVGFFIEYGARGNPPDPFVRRTAKWAEDTMPQRAAEALRDIL